MRLAICIPTYNRADYLEEAIGSVLSQASNAIDIHVFDNASTDKTHALMSERFAGVVTYHRHTENLGYVGNINSCIALYSNYDWIGILHSDDRYEPDCLRRVSKLLQENANAGILFSVAHQMDENGHVFKRLHPSKNLYKRGRQAIERCQKQLPCSTTFYNCVALSIFRVFNSTYPYSADEEFNARVASQFDIVEADCVIASYRRHSTNGMLETWRKKDFITNFESMRLTISSYIQPLTPLSIAATRRALCRTFLHCATELSINGYHDEAQDFLRYIWRANPTLFLYPRYGIQALLLRIPLFGPRILRGLRALKRL